MQVPWFKSQRSKHSGRSDGGGSSGGGGGSFSGGSGKKKELAPRRERPGFGYHPEPKPSASQASYQSGPAMDRVSNYKQALASQYKSHFVGATTTKPLNTIIVQQQQTEKREADSADSGEKKKKSRWDK